MCPESDMVMPPHVLRLAPDDAPPPPLPPPPATAEAAPPPAEFVAGVLQMPISRSVIPQLGASKHDSYTTGGVSTGRRKQGDKTAARLLYKHRHQTVRHATTTTAQNP